MARNSSDWKSFRDNLDKRSSGICYYSANGIGKQIQRLSFWHVQSFYFRKIICKRTVHLAVFLFSLHEVRIPSSYAFTHDPQIDFHKLYTTEIPSDNRLQYRRNFYCHQWKCIWYYPSLQNCWLILHIWKYMNVMSTQMDLRQPFARTPCCKISYMCSNSVMNTHLRITHLKWRYYDDFEPLALKNLKEMRITTTTEGEQHTLISWGQIYM